MHLMKGQSGLGFITDISAGGHNHPHIICIDKRKCFSWRNEAYKTFLQDIEVGYVDVDLVPFIRMIFEEKKEIFTISSCSGRIIIVDTQYPWLREGAHIVFKKHKPVNSAEIVPLLTMKPLTRLWLVVSGPIFHFVTCSLEAAITLLKIAREAGFKHSGIMSIREDGVVIELISGTWTSFLLKDGDRYVVEPHNLDNIIRVVNEILIEGKKRLGRLFIALRKADL